WTSGVTEKIRAAIPLVQSGCQGAMRDSRTSQGVPNLLRHRPRHQVDVGIRLDGPQDVVAFRDPGSSLPMTSNDHEELRDFSRSIDADMPVVPGTCLAGLRQPRADVEAQESPTYAVGQAPAGCRVVGPHHLTPSISSDRYRPV